MIEEELPTLGPDVRRKEIANIVANFLQDNRGEQLLDDHGMTTEAFERFIALLKRNGH